MCSAKTCSPSAECKCSGQLPPRICKRGTWASREAIGADHFHSISCLGLLHVRIANPGLLRFDSRRRLEPIPFLNVTFSKYFFCLNSAYLFEIFLLQNLFVGWSRSGPLASHLDAQQFVQALWFHTVGVIMWTSDLYEYNICIFIYIYKYFYTHSFFKNLYSLDHLQ